MDIQIKKGLLEVCVLAILQREDSYGYKMIRDISDYIEISESTLYPILKRLENGQCLTTYSVEHNGRLRKYYSITDTGRERIRSFIAEWSEIVRVYDFIVQEEKDE
ncbi:PadR family transcriptional regulator [Candidatus Soleaferrea massiliensis]|uniref:PadR family transcriptional regulator n=1 Tax=Candidatus Soleaferrea massiliensis TaxID=1470354 RepID=UPI00058B3445|nr:PadR family transcriptional regulator [Candidatus Soleaferrea massiliensis]